MTPANKERNLSIHSALALFCIAIDWILGHLDLKLALHCFTDLAYADDAMIFLPNKGQAASTLAAFSKARTKLQNLEYRPQSSDITITGSTVDGVEEFLYLGSKQHLMEGDFQM